MIVRSMFHSRRPYAGALESEVDFTPRVDSLAMLTGVVFSVYNFSSWTLSDLTVKGLCGFNCS